MVTITVSQVVVDVNERDFQREVIERSHEVPVVVDFWAPWCAPCRMLGPVLESLAQEFSGRFVLAKVNTDENPRLATRFGIQGIPAVKAFKNGRVIAEFVGAQPRPIVRRFIEQLLPNEVDAKVAEGRRLLAAGRFSEAEAQFQEVLSKQPDHPAALLGRAQALLGLGQDEAALKLLNQVPAATPEGAEAARLRAQVALRRWADNGDEADLKAHLTENPADLEARYQLASLLASQQRYEEALEHFLEVIRRDRKFRNGDARQAMLHIFELLGDHPLTRAYRNKLASVLFA
ncbi:MAG: thioredoxin [Anaerolineae bacterium]|nr:thioredoxin [Anaerolineae bacterium]MDW8099428.1 thioredoxin [Anaerolineae bacterium]